MLARDVAGSWPELITAMDRHAKQTMAQLQEAEVFELRLSRGECREAVVTSAFRPGPPERCGLGSGEVVGADCSRSQALDFQWHFEDWVSSIA